MRTKPILHFELKRTEFLKQYDEVSGPQKECTEWEEPMPEKVEHVVSGGDYLGKLAAKYNTPVGAIRMMNGLHGDNLRIGQKLLVPAK